VSGEQSSVGRAVKDRLLGTQAAPVCEAGALIQGGLMTADGSQSFERHKAGSINSIQTDG
jgi:hypothetical protein